jgi:anti-anti-sigma regulatory factor
MTLQTREIDDVTVLAPTVGMWSEEDTEVVCRAVSDLVAAGRTKLLLDLSAVRWLSSTGIKGAIQAYERAHELGAQLVMCHVQGAPALRDKVLIPVVDNVDTAARHFDSVSMTIPCPVDGCGGAAHSPLLDGEGGCQCRRCGVAFGVLLRFKKGTDEFESFVGGFRLETYPDEHVAVSLDGGAGIWLRGRLDLFASEQIERAWRSIPAPAAVVIDLTAATDVSDAGARAVAALRGRTAEGKRTEIIWPGE